MASLYNSIHAPSSNGEQPDEHLELATTDADLKAALRDSRWLQDRHFDIPPWMDTVPEIIGTPGAIPSGIQQKLRDGAIPQTRNERRFVRNRAVIKQIAANFRRQEALTQGEIARQKAGAVMRTQDPRLPFATTSGFTLKGNQTAPPSTAPASLPALQNTNGSDRASFSSRPPLRSLDTEKNQSHEHHGPAQQSAQGTVTTQISSGQLRPSALLFEPQSIQHRPPSSAPPSVLQVQITNGITACPDHELKVLSKPESEQEEADRLRRTVLAPFYQRIQQDSEEIIRLRKESADMTAEIERHKSQLVELQQDTAHDSAIEDIQPRGLKRKASPTSPMKLGDTANGSNEHTTAGHLMHLANKICKDLGETVPSETIHFCGLAPLKIMEQRPDEVLALAHQKLHTWPYQHVPTCWRRLYEDASLSKAAELLKEQAGASDEEGSVKRPRIEDGGQRNAVDVDDWIGKIVKTLDMGISLSGTPGRSSTFEAVFQQLCIYIQDAAAIDMPPRFSVAPPMPLDTDRPISRKDRPPSFEAFQRHLDTATTPLITRGALTQWPASKKWNDPSYFLRMTLGGRRLVPVEVGKSYTEEAWSQTIMPFGKFMKNYLLPTSPKETGYLAQHDLFAQIPALKEDITIPDYCYTTPPDLNPNDPASKTAGLATAPALSEPLLNAWLGPKGTKTPLHTDPYHNILCQVVGCKYVRLYSPSETPNLYPLGIDANGVSMENTASVDVSHVRSRSLGGSTDLDAIREQRKRFPAFEDAKFVEGILGPGECLYVPLGWWHYVEGLTVGFSVSFWWN